MMMNNVRSMLLNGQQQHTMVAAAATLLHCFSSSAPRQIVYHHNVESSLLAFSLTCNSRPQPNIFSRFSKFASKLQQQQQRQAVISSAVPEKDLPRERVHEHGIICSEFPPVSVQSEPISDTLQAAIWRHSLEQPEHPAFISAHDPNERISYDDLLRQCHFVSDFLDSIGFGRGDVAGVILRNTWHFLAIFLGATLRGGCITGANIQLTNDEIARQMKLANCRVVFCEDSLLNRMCAIKEMYPEMEHLVLVPSEPSAKPLANLPPNIHNWAELEQSRPNTIGIRPAHADIDVNRDMAFLPFSSGTTGAGKGVMLSHKSVGTMLRILNNHFDNYVVKRMDPNWDWTSENSMMILPLYHIYGFVNSLNNLLCGSTGIIFKKFDLELFCRIVQDYKIKQVSLVPPILVYLAKSPELLARFDLSSLRLIMTGAAPLGEDLYHEVKRQIPSLEQLCQGYGMTEQSMCSHLPVYGWHNVRAAGRLNPNFEMKIVDVQTRQPVELGQVGEICTRSPTTMIGYLNNPKATAETIDADGWLRTGDIGYCDEHGWTYVVDRLKELIKVKGLQVAPAELEDTLLSHPGIKDCAVVGVRDELCGEVPKAFVVRADATMGEEEVKNFIKDRLAAYKQLKYVEFVESIPKSPSGKILRRCLRQQK